MFVAFVGNTSPWIYIPKNKHSFNIIFKNYTKLANNEITFP